MRALEQLRQLCTQAESSGLLGLQKVSAAAARLRTSGGIRLKQSRLNRLRTRQQAIGFFLDHGVTLATQLFQFWPVQYRDLAAGVADDPEFVQLARGLGDTFTAHAEHVGDKFLGHSQLVGGANGTAARKTGTGVHGGANTFFRT
jgi:hypothetical protein